MAVTIAVCDDDFTFLDKTMRNLIANAARKCEMTLSINFFTDSAKLLREFKKGNLFDIVILDIDMPRIDGKQLAEKLRLIDSSFYLIFVTSYKMEIFNTIKYDFKTFITKSSNIREQEDELVRIFNDFLSKSIQYEVFEILRDGCPNTYKIPLCNITAFYMVDKIIYLKTTTEDIVLQEKIFSKISDLYLNKGFYSNYRNYIVNISKVKEIGDTYIILNNNEKLPLSKRSKKPLLKALSEYVMVEVDK